MSDTNGLTSYRKKNVDAYIAEMQARHLTALKEKDLQYAELAKKHSDLMAQHATLSAEVIELQKDKSRVANVLLGAESTAASIIEQARGDAEKERTDLLAQLERLREEVIDRNRLIQKMKQETACVCNDLKAKLDEFASLAESQLSGLQAETQDGEINA